jgi:hypothetical protein
MTNETLLRTVESFITVEPDEITNLRGCVLTKIPYSYIWHLWRSVGVHEGQTSTHKQCREMNRRYNIQAARVELYVWACLLIANLHLTSQE